MYFTFLSKKDTSKELIEETFKELTESNDIAIILITQDVSFFFFNLIIE